MRRNRGFAAVAVVGGLLAWTAAANSLSPNSPQLSTTGASSGAAFGTSAPAPADEFAAIRPYLNDGF